MSRLRSTATACGVGALLYLPRHANFAGTSKVAETAPLDPWGPEARLPDGSLAQFTKDLARPRVKIVFASGDTATLAADRRQITGAGWIHRLGTGPDLQVADRSSGARWCYDFNGRLL